MLRLRTLGGLSIENAASIGGATANRRPLALLALLAVNGRRGLSRDKIVALLWPESDAEHGRNSLSQVISLLRRELAADDIVLGTAELRVNTDVIACDVIEFEQRIGTDDLEAATKLYTGPFLDGVFLKNTPDFERWVDQERSRLQHVQGDALETLAARASAGGDHVSAVRFWRQRASLAPNDSRAAHKLMQSLVASGDPAGALEHYRVHHALLRDDLGLEPDATLAEFAAALRGGMSRSAPNDLSPQTAASAQLRAGTRAQARENGSSQDEPMQIAGLIVRRRGRWIGATLALLAAIAAGLTWRAMRSGEPRVSQLSHLLPDGTVMHYSGAALSPDGTTIVYAAAIQGSTPSPPRLYVWRLGELQARPLPKTEGAAYPFFSPDGGSVGFTVDDRLKTISLADSAMRSVVDSLGLPCDPVDDASWGDDGHIVLGASCDRQTLGIRRVSAQGGTVQVLSRPDHPAGERAHFAPQHLPGTNQIIYTIRNNGAQGQTYRVVVQDINSAASRTLIEGARLARYIKGGWIAYQIDEDVFVARFDVRTLAVSSERRRVLEVVPWMISTRAWAANADVFIYQPAIERRGSLVWVARDGTRDSLPAPPDNYEEPNISPSGGSVALIVRPSTRRTDAWTFDLRRSMLTRVSSDGRTVTSRWTPDGKRLAYSYRTETGRDVYTRAADGSSPPELLFGNGGVLWPADWTRDMQTLVVMQHDIVNNGGDLFTLDVASKELSELVRTPASEYGGRLSPDGRWLAYASNASGRFEVYVTAFPGARGRWQVSQDGGREAMWSKDGRELFFRNGKALLAVAVRPGATFNSSAPQVLFAGNYMQGGGPGTANYDISSDGKRFLMVEEPPRGAPRLNVIQGWRRLWNESAAPNR